MIPQQLPRVRFSWWFFFFFLFFFFLSTAAFIPHHALDCGCFLPLPAHCRDPSAQSCHTQCSVMSHLPRAFSFFPLLPLPLIFIMVIGLQTFSRPSTFPASFQLTVSTALADSDYDVAALFPPWAFPRGQITASTTSSQAETGNGQ